MVTSNRYDDVGFGGFRNRVWAALRRQFLERMDPTKLEGEVLAQSEYPKNFLRNFKQKWRDETGSAWNANNTTQSLFKAIVKKAMLQEVQKHLDGVVGLMKMEWPLFQSMLSIKCDRAENKSKTTTQAYAPQGLKQTAPGISAA